ncbi:MAG: IreB family regulatory phosphoprotein [Mollicutes bacterium]|nr:IreB family regulatory phosphoprotein [Mollicutes bacterium]
MKGNKTTIFNVSMLKQELIIMSLNEIAASLEKAGYNATNQLVGYLLSGDLSYITSYEDAREKISKFTRDEILMAIINGYFGK